MKRLISLVAVMLFAVPLVAQTRQGGCIQVVAGSEQKNKGAFDTLFSATKVLDIDLGILFTPGAVQRFGENHTVEFRVLAPTGNLYQSLTVPFTADSGKKGQNVRVEGYSHPVPLQVLKPVSLGGQPHFEAYARIPVAGTAIMTSSLYGRWQVQAYVDGESLPCAANASFNIVP